MSKSKMTADRKFEVTPSVKRFINYFSDLGPRWGLSADTCKVHALLYLAAQPLAPDAIAKHAELTKNRTAAAIKDLLGWRVAIEKEDGISIVGGEPIDLMFSALEERARREIAPAVKILHTCKKEASEERQADSKSTEKISAMLQLVEDLTALEKQSGRFTTRPFSRLVKVGGRAARLLDRAFPRARKGGSDGRN